ncbi:MAG: orotate phosphoribosyltransferase, partial [Elusimicrobiota bacterium]
VLRAAGAEVVAAGSIVDRSEGKSALGVPYAALWTASAPSWKPDNCPLCKSGASFIKPGSRKEPK